MSIAAAWVAHNLWGNSSHTAKQRHNGKQSKEGIKAVNGCMFVGILACFVHLLFVEAQTLVGILKNLRGKANHLTRE